MPGFKHLEPSIRRSHEARSSKELLRLSLESCESVGMAIKVRKSMIMQPVRGAKSNQHVVAGDVEPVLPSASKLLRHRKRRTHKSVARSVPVI